MDSIVKAYAGTGQAEAGRKFLADFQTLEKMGYRVISQRWDEDPRDFTWFLWFHGGFRLRTGTLTVTYQLATDANNPVSPKTDQGRR